MQRLFNPRHPVHRQPQNKPAWSVSLSSWASLLMKHFGSLWEYATAMVQRHRPTGDCRMARGSFWMHAVALVLALASGCSPGGSDRSSAENSTTAAPGRPYIVATTGMVADLVKQVVGDRAEVVGLMGEGVDPHLYKPTIRDIKELDRANIIFYNGLMLEGRMQDALERVRSRGRIVHAVTDGLARDRLLAPAQFAGHYDPHVWMDVSMWSECVEYVAAKMADHDPAGGPYYHARAANYREQLQQLDDYVRRVIRSIPESQRVLVTAHDAFNYFSHAYGIPVRAPQGISTETEPGVRDINELVHFLVERKIPAIFVETSVSEANLRAVLEGAARLGWKVRIGGSLYSDAMGPSGTYEGTYIGMIDHNATVIARALGGAAPPRGMQGKLSILLGSVGESR